MRQHSAADEIDFETEQVVLRVRLELRASAAPSTSNSRLRKRLTCGAMPISRFERASGGSGASGAWR
jgi:hypothetical protein